MGNLRHNFAALSLIFALLIGLAQVPAFAASSDDEDNVEGCPAADTVKRSIENNNRALDRAKSKIPFNQRTVENLEAAGSKLEEKLGNANDSCDRKKDRLDRDYNKCQKKMANAPGLYKWNVDKQTCEDQQAKNEKPNNNTGACNNAELMKGSNLKGENCKVAEDAVRDVKSRQEAVDQTALVATQAYAGMQASQTTGAQADVQQRQANVLKGLAMVKIASGVLAMSGAATLKSAASGAEEASTNINGAYKNLDSYCNQDSMIAKMTPEQCFYLNAKSQGLDANAKNYATFERMKSGADQSQEAADKANALAKTAMITGAANAAVGIQAMYLARQSAQAANNFGPPPLINGGAVPLGVMSGNSGGSPGLGGIGAVPGATLAGNDGVTLGGSDGGQIKGGLIGGRPQVYNSYKPEKSSVSGGGGVGGGGGGGRGGGGGASRKGGGKGNTASGEYTNSGSGPGGTGGSRGGAKDAAAGSNPLADMMSKLFPPNESGKPVVDARDPASTEAEHTEEQAETGGVAVNELSLFEQVSTRYRSLNGAGQI
jgi:hypothetical protein